MVVFLPWSSILCLREAFSRGDAFMKEGQPDFWIVAHFFSDGIQQGNVVGRAGQNMQKIGHPTQVELHDRRTVALFH